MGTTFSWYYVKNEGHTPESIRAGLKSLGETAYAAWRPDAPFFPVFSEDLCEGYTAGSHDAAYLSDVFHASVLCFAAFDSDVAFASWYDAATGARADIINAPEELLEDFEAPEEEALEEFLEDFKASDEGFEEGDAFVRAFPEFLLQFCPPASHERLREIWGDTEYVFAEERIYETAEILGVPVLFEDPDQPVHPVEGFITIMPE